MLSATVLRLIDGGLVVIANLVNLLMIGLFLSRAAQRPRVTYVVGLAVNALAVPVTAAVLANALGGRGWWRVVLPTMLVAFLLVDVVVDYVVRWDIRRTRALGPYLGLYYLALWGMIGYAFLVDRLWGFVTLATYFLNLLATWYAYARVGHGSVPRWEHSDQGRLPL